MTTDLVSAATLIVVLVVLCAVIKMYLTVINMQPCRGDHLAHVRDMQPVAMMNAQQHCYSTVRMRGTERQTVQRVGTRPRPQENDERYY